MDRRRALQAAGHDDLRFSDLDENSDAYSDEDDSDNLPKMGLKERLEGIVEEDDDKPKRIPGLRHIKDIKNSLGLDAIKDKAARKRERKRRAKDRKRAAVQGNTNGSADMVATEATRRASEVKPVEVVAYSDPKNRKKGSKGTAEALAAKDETLDESRLSMKQARFDVYKFGVSGFEKGDREDAELATLIRLGAKPPKNEKKHLEDLKKERKKQKEEEKERQALKRLSNVRNMMVKKPSAKQGGGGKAGKKGKKSGENIHTKVGKFDGGMLKLSAKDIAAVRGSKK